MAERLSACHLELAVFVPPLNFGKVALKSHMQVLSLERVSS